MGLTYSCIKNKENNEEIDIDETKLKELSKLNLIKNT